eukprot:UN07778
MNFVHKPNMDTTCIPKNVCLYRFMFLARILLYLWITWCIKRTGW